MTRTSAFRRRIVGRFVPRAQRLPAGVRHRLNFWRGIEQPRVVDLPPGRTVLVVAPHPDDEMLGGGATLAKHCAAGHDVHLVFVTSGEASVGLRGGADAVATRESEATAAAQSAVPGAKLHFLRFADGKVDESADALRAALEAVIGEVQPDLVYAPNPHEAHHDHVAVANVVLDLVGTSAAIEHVAWYEVWTPVLATHVVDVTDYIDMKVAALRCYRSQLDVLDYVRTAEGLAAFRSAHLMHGRGYAEAFVILTRAELALAWREA